MGKAAMCIKMLQYLNTGRVYRVSELAELLETNPRNIIEYKKELDEMSVDSTFYIETIPGRYGGYKINGNAVIPALKLMQDEKDVLLESYNYILTKKDFVKKDVATAAFSKVLSNVKITNKENDLMVVDKYQLTMNEKDIQERYLFLEQAIKLKRAIKIEYNSLKSGQKTHVLHPYKLFIYNNSWFFLAWDVEKCDVLYFKVNRIKEYTMLDTKFTVWKYFKAENYFDETGLKNNGDYYHVEFYATGTRCALMKERVYGKNQKVEEISKDKVKVSLEMQNNDAIVSFILGCGSEVQVIEPEWLKTRVQEEIKKIKDLY